MATGNSSLQSLSNVSILGKVMEQDFLEIIFKHVNSRKLSRKSPHVQALDLTPVPCFPHSVLHCKT